MGCALAINFDGVSDTDFYWVDFLLRAARATD
jgi:hypothetical protein